MINQEVPAGLVCCLGAHIDLAKFCKRGEDKFARSGLHGMLVSMAKAAVADAFAQRKIEGWTLHVQDEEWILQRVQGPLLQVYQSQCSTTSTRQHYSG